MCAGRLKFATDSYPGPINLTIALHCFGADRGLCKRFSYVGCVTRGHNIVQLAQQMAAYKRIKFDLTVTRFTNA